MRQYTRSKELYDRACNVLAGGVSSEFRKYSYPHPLFYSHGFGSRIWDVDGNEYLDFTLSQGPLILGHSNPRVLSAVAEASLDHQLVAGQHLRELELGEMLQRLIPCAELLRFDLTGSEAVHAAIRAARAKTARSRIVRFEGQYHGWLDGVCYGISAPSEEALGPRDNPNALPWTDGLPRHGDQDTILLPWNDSDLLARKLARHGADVAAVIMEPVMANCGCIPPEPGFLKEARRLCDRCGAALIFDEVITGFRLGPGGAQELYEVTPDLAVFGKAMASGYPISALAGRRSYMLPFAEGTAIHAGTMNSNTPGVAAAIATLQIIEQEHVNDRLFAHGQRLMRGLRDAASRAGVDALIQGPGPMFHLAFTKQSSACDYRDTLHFDRGLSSRFVAAMHERGIRLIGRGLWYVSAAHSDADIEQAIATAGEVMREVCA